ncbi:glutamine synthetase [Tessaracoccus sp. MC1865]|uniref:glutamine synthetase family protein n=1 Tax=unclassified Tessaracoccus TaxID=2635419 RepID=UPI00096DEA03|nr:MULTISPECIES: glutamine synthetase family protein [unclassified Tessaracoccus]MBB1483688.1 glutamine synthetase [Tessaracoccus sp. MC1865]MCG6566070.1 glutamine synthetase [Tessaracoccus sp. ZS01]OMG58577.1 glutamine synthetase [Tessaracoccus sp. ZS01]QTO38956.1 glutamine synthetase [Tessaracoccus sp. MC1865]
MEERGIRFVRLWFTDVLGSLKSVAIAPAEVEGAIAEGVGFDGSAIEGFARVYESDMVAHPDASTYQVLPWRQAGRSTARMFCDIKLPDGSPSFADPRFVLKRALGKAADLGYTFYIHPEIEFFLLRSLNPLVPLDQGGYFDHTTLGDGTDFRRDVITILEQMGISVEFSHHEAAPGQHEIDLRYADALTMADNIMTFRVVVREVAVSQDIHATFMPKPFSEHPGSGMHTHMSLFEGDTNVFYDAADQYNLSKTAKQFIAGLLHHAPEITAVTNQWVNSYKRLVGGGEAPSYACWGRANRSALVRVPQFTPGKTSSARIEYRAIDSAVNPYLAYAVMLNAGLKGIEGEYQLPEETEDEVWRLSDRERKAIGIQELPRNLDEAIRIMDESELVAETLGEHVYEYFMRNKRKEFAAYRQQVTPWELDRHIRVM